MEMERSLAFRISSFSDDNIYAMTHVCLAKWNYYYVDEHFQESRKFIFNCYAPGVIF